MPEPGRDPRARQPDAAAGGVEPPATAAVARPGPMVGQDHGDPTVMAEGGAKWKGALLRNRRVPGAHPETGGYLQRPCADSSAAVKPSRENVSTVVVPRVETPSTITSTPARNALTSWLSSAGVGAHAFSPSVNMR